MTGDIQAPVTKGIFDATVACLTSPLARMARVVKKGAAREGSAIMRCCCANSG